MTKRLIGLSFLTSAICFSLATAADVDVSIFAQIRLGKAPPPPPPEVIVVEADRRGPPPWAPAHGRRAKRGYYYYPGCNVYYRPADRMWFFLDGGNWQIGATLPTHIHVDFNRSVSLELDVDRPFVRHREIVAYYPADYFTRVKVKHAGRSSAGLHIRIHDDDHRGHPGKGHKKHRGKGKGKGRKK